MASEVSPSALRPRQADGWGPGLALALGVHLLLVGALALGVSWKMDSTEPIEAEVWAELPTSAAPAAPAPEPAVPAPEPPAVPPPVPSVSPQPAQAPEPTPVPEPVPDIAVARPPKPKPEPKPEPQKRKTKEPVEVFESAPPKLAKKTAKTDKAQETPQNKPKDTAKDKPSDKASALAAAEREAQRRTNLARMMGDLGSMGSAAQSGGPTAAYGGRIKARIKPNIVFTESVSGNPVAVVEVRCAPDGRIVSRRLLKSSGWSSWDEAVLRAVDRTEVLPANESGRVPPVIELEFKPHDF